MSHVHDPASECETDVFSKDATTDESKYLPEQIYYMQVSQLLAGWLPGQLCTLFKDVWDKGHATPWVDGESGIELYNKVPKQVRHRGPTVKTLKTIKDDSISEWDCTAFFYAFTIRTIHEHLSDEQWSGIKDLRDFRNNVVHKIPGKLSKEKKIEMCEELEKICKCLNIDVTKVNSVKKDSYPRTKELSNQLELLERFKGLALGAFEIYPQKSGHKVATRKEKVREIIADLENLRQSYPNEVTELHLTGNPGCGKSQLALQCALELSKVKIFKIIMTIDARNDAALEKSYEMFAENLNASDDFMRVIRQQPMRIRLTSLKNWIAQKLRKSKERWLIIVDNLEDDFYSEWFPTSNAQDWGVGQVLFTSQLEHFAKQADEHVKVVSLKEGLTFEEAKSLMLKISKKLGDEEDLRNICEMLDFQPLSLAHASLDVRYANSVTWTQYRQIFSERMSNSNPKRALVKQHSDQVLEGTQYKMSMIDATRGCIERMRSSDLILQHAFHYLAYLTSDHVPFDALIHYVMSKDEIKELDPPFDKVIVEERLASCSLLIMDSMNLSKFSASENIEYVAVRTHQVVNKFF